MRMRCRVLVTRVIEIRNLNKILVVKSEGKRPFGRHRSGLESKSKISQTNQYVKLSVVFISAGQDTSNHQPRDR